MKFDFTKLMEHLQCTILCWYKVQGTRYKVQGRSDEKRIFYNFFMFHMSM